MDVEWNLFNSNMGAGSSAPYRPTYMGVYGPQGHFESFGHFAHKADSRPPVIERVGGRKRDHHEFLTDICGRAPDFCRSKSSRGESSARDRTHSASPTTVTGQMTESFSPMNGVSMTVDSPIMAHALARHGYGHTKSHSLHRANSEGNPTHTYKNTLRRTLSSNLVPSALLVSPSLESNSLSTVNLHQNQRSIDDYFAVRPSHQRGYRSCLCPPGSYCRCDSRSSQDLQSQGMEDGTIRHCSLQTHVFTLAGMGNANSVMMCPVCNHSDSVAVANNIWITCHYCSKNVCMGCIGSCVKCQENYCKFCSTKNYSGTFEVTVCLDCNQ